MEVPNVLELLPQQPPFIMISRYTHISDTAAEAELDITPENIFCEGGFLTEPGLVEHVAQTCAARIGYLTLQQSKPVRMGTIGTVKNFTVQFLPPVGSILRSEIEVVSEVMDITLVAARLYCAGREVAQGEMKIAVVDSHPPLLRATTDVTVRFSEVDSMNIVWHGSYVKYFEDAREAFGKKYQLDYLTIFGNGFYAPLVDLQMQYKSPLIYGDTARVTITYVPTDSAKLIFKYEVHAGEDNRLVATGQTTQVFLDKAYRLSLQLPPFFRQWRLDHNQPCL